MTAAAPAQTDDGLFDGSQYKIPFPPVDGKEVDELVVRFGGTLKLNRHDPIHTAFVEGLTLGQYVSLNATVSVGGKGQHVRYRDDDSEIVSHTVGLNVQSIDFAQNGR